MFLRQLYDTPLAQASYLIGCQLTDEAIVVDPTRDIEPYLDMARAEGLRITHVTETHIHADFVSGARELAARTGAKLLLSAEGGSDWQYAYAASDGATLLHDGDVFMIGNLRFQVMHTPGHTPEHLAFVVTDTPAAAGPMGLLSGDFVFVGDVGRPDLLERAAHVANTMEVSAHALFHSLERFRTLPDYLQLWPGHGAGSACGKALGAVPSSTVGYEKLANWGVATTDEQEFVRMVLDGQPEPPRYFAEMKRINRDGPRVLHGFPHPAHLSAESVLSLMDTNAWVLDLRKAATYAKGHVPRTLSIPYSRSFSTWAGWLVPYDADITLLVQANETGGESDIVRSAVRDLAMIGLDRVTGWLDASALEAWHLAGRSLDTITQISVESLARERAAAHVQVVDVRGHAEWESSHIPGVANIPVGQLLDETTGQPNAALSSSPLVLHCQGGSRSSIAASLLKRAGFTDVMNLTGGIDEWRRAGFDTEHE